jgi:hypothetical protein
MKKESLTKIDRQPLPKVTFRMAEIRPSTDNKDLRLKGLFGSDYPLR